LRSLGLEEDGRQHHPKAAQKKRRCVKTCIAPKIGEEDVDSLTASAVMDSVIRPIEDKGLLDTSHLVKGSLFQILRFGVANGLARTDVTAGLANALILKRVRHRASFTDPAKVGRLILDIRGYTGQAPVTYALRILPYVFVMPGEPRHDEWEEFDFEERLWKIPAEKMKMRQAHLVPLSDQVIAMINWLKEHTGHGKYLFPGRNLKSVPISDMAINSALRYLGYQRD
jgi:integrase